MSKLKQGEFVRDIELENKLKADLKKNGGSLKVLISIKMDPNLLKRIKASADKIGIGYQTLIQEKLEEAFPDKKEKDQSKKIIRQIKLLVDDLTVSIGK